MDGTAAGGAYAGGGGSDCAEAASAAGTVVAVSRETYATPYIQMGAAPGA